MRIEASPGGDDGAPRPLTEHDGHQLAAAFDRALAEGLPIVGVLAAAGVDPARGIAATASWGAAARSLARASGRVPIVLGVDGPLHSGPALLLGLADVRGVRDGARHPADPHAASSERASGRRLIWEQRYWGLTVLYRSTPR